MHVLIRYLCLLISFMYRAANSLEVSLTTAKLRQSTSPKPTTLYRRINVEINNYDSSSSSTLFDLFKYVESRRKKGSKNSYIWNWDHWCHLQPTKGHCEKTLNRFYYDTRLDKCKPFVYSGCDGNKNNFPTFVDCERHCNDIANCHYNYVVVGMKMISPNVLTVIADETVKDMLKLCMRGAIYMDIKDLIQPAFCSLQPNKGFCLGLILKYYYDINEKMCKKFYYGGCGGNQNKFGTMSSCMKVCSDII